MTALHAKSKLFSVHRLDLTVPRCRRAPRTPQARSKTPLVRLPFASAHCFACALRCLLPHVSHDPFSVLKQCATLVWRAGDIKDGAADAAGNVKDKLGNAADEAGNKADKAAGEAKSASGNLGDKAKSAADDAKGGIKGAAQDAKGAAKDVRCLLCLVFAAVSALAIVSASRDSLRISSSMNVRLGPNLHLVLLTLMCSVMRAGQG